MTTCVAAINDWSCGLACIESVLRDCGLSISQAQMIADLGEKVFPSWAELPGILSGADFGDVFMGVGFEVSVVLPKTFQESIQLINAPNTIGAILATSRFWESPAKDSLMDLNHAMRLVDADNRGVTVMNPLRAPNLGVVERYEWQEIDKFKCQVFAFQR